jgi:hypothetical protein
MSLSALSFSVFLSFIYLGYQSSISALFSLFFYPCGKRWEQWAIIIVSNKAGETEQQVLHR